MKRLEEEEYAFSSHEFQRSGAELVDSKLKQGFIVIEDLFC